MTAEERELLRVDGATREAEMAWSCVANPARCSWQDTTTATVDFRFGRIQQNFHEVQEGDLVFAYESTPKLQVTALARVDRTLHHSNQERVITLKQQFR